MSYSFFFFMAPDSEDAKLQINLDSLHTIGDFSVFLIIKQDSVKLFTYMSIRDL